MTCIPELACSILATQCQSTWLDFEMASRRETIPQQMLFFAFTGAWLHSLLRVKEEDSGES